MAVQHEVALANESDIVVLPAGGTIGIGKFVKITAGSVTVVTGTGSVSTGENNADYDGVALHDAVSGEDVRVVLVGAAGQVYVQVAGPVAIGDYLAINSSGQGVKQGIARDESCAALVVGWKSDGAAGLIYGTEVAGQLVPVKLL